MNTALLIMAAGIGSRFGGGIKQLEPVGLSGEIIMDYSVHDAVRSGFNKIIFVIRKDIEKDFRERIGDRLERRCLGAGVSIAYAYQSLEDIPEGFAVPAGRTKPWGTGQAVLAARHLIKEPFIVINADDYYGKEAFVQLHDWLLAEHGPGCIAMAGFRLKNTLSENGGVTRGICRVAPGRTHALDVTETRGIVKTPAGVSAGGKQLDPESFVSMNMLAFPAREGERPEFLSILERGFAAFFERLGRGEEDPLKMEYLLPTLIGQLLRGREVSVKILETSDRWFGVTYREDKEAVTASFQELIDRGEYERDLYSDLGQN